MTFSLPSIDYQFATADTDYITRFNTNFQQINNAFIGARTDINNLNNQQGISLAEDWTRVSEAGDPSGGILGPRSFMITHISGSPDTITLSHGNADGFSYAYIGGEKRQTSDTLTVSPPTIGQGVRYIGISADSLTGNITAIENSAPATSGELVLYKYDYNAGTASNFRRMPRTLLMSNTLEQAKQETPNLLHMQLVAQGVTIASSSLAAYDHATRFTIPYDHVWTGGRFHMTSNAATGSTQEITVDLLSGTSVMKADLSAGGTVIDFSVETAYVDKIIAANTDYSIGLDYGGGSITNPSATINFLQSFNVPVV